MRVRKFGIAENIADQILGKYGAPGADEGDLRHKAVEPFLNNLIAKEQRTESKEQTPRTILLFVLCSLFFVLELREPLCLCRQQLLCHRANLWQRADGAGQRVEHHGVVNRLALAG